MDPIGALTAIENVAAKDESLGGGVLFSVIVIPVPSVFTFELVPKPDPEIVTVTLVTAVPKFGDMPVICGAFTVPPLPAPPPKPTGHGLLPP